MRTGLFLVCAALLPYAAQAACHMRLAYADQETPPYQMGTGNVVPDKPGIAVELVREAVQVAGCTLQLTRLPNKRVVAEVGIGLYDGAIMYSYSDERAKQLVYPMLNGLPDPQRRLASLSYYLYRRSNGEVTWDGTRILGLGNGAIGTNLGFSIGKELAALGYPVEETTTTLQNLLKLRAKRIEAYAMQDTIADAAIHGGHFDDIEKLPKPLSTKDYYLAFSKRYNEGASEDINRVWQALSEIRTKRTHELANQYLTH